MFNTDRQLFWPGALIRRDSYEQLELGRLSENDLPVYVAIVW